MKLTRRRVWVAVIVFVAVAASFLLIILVFGGDRITQANMNRIHKGMTLEQVKEILGLPTSATFEIYMDGKLPDVVVAKPYYWEGTRGTATVYIRDNIAIDKAYVPKQIPWWSRLKGFFGL